MAVTVLQLAEHVLGRRARTGADFIEADLPILGGCQTCAASIGAFNAFPSTTGYLQCADCIDDTIGFVTVEEAKAALWPNGHPHVITHD